MVSKPLPGEYTKFQETYVSMVGNLPVLDVLIESKKNTHAFLSSVPLDKEEYAYAEGKWTIKEVVGHMIDTERIFAYRLLCFARGEQKPLPGFEQDDYVLQSFANDRVLSDLADEFRVIRESTLYLVRNLNEKQLLNIGTSSGNPLSARALVYMIAGHELHHIKILKEKYI
ncbi:Uncharacterized damage-inducible protein DinB (forms a four-helix bundle) [Chitinophaga sp. CF118]|uniref:DinB family protein n=1 Tax=Chitinophaga sp. CF118 TaxID=1884367 RepID=UPI0008F15970|nr:DinB family protein [Chitinophaga sp. CF118]SFD09136.1 Uncharacterized damage-inducible protein DinB (forms a four-helix bundle) [Chitinophaga sp. CF118]